MAFLPDVLGSHAKWAKDLRSAALPQRQSYGLPPSQDCAESAKIPNMTTCPERLMDWGLLANYYNQMHGSMRGDVFCKLNVPLVPHLWVLPSLG